MVLRELLYADDTVLLSTSEDNLQRLLNAVITEGAKYGLELNWSKTFQMNVGTNIKVYRPGGAQLEIKRSLMYLGGLVSCDGRCEGALNRKLSEGRSIFRSVCRIWSHASICQNRKLVIFNACVVSKC